MCTTFITYIGMCTIPFPLAFSNFILGLPTAMIGLEVTCTYKSVFWIVFFITKYRNWGQSSELVSTYMYNYQIRFIRKCRLIKSTPGLPRDPWRPILFWRWSWSSPSSPGPSSPGWPSGAFKFWTRYTQLTLLTAGFEAQNFKFCNRFKNGPLEHEF
jgi:hypothetical protein